MSKRRPEYNHLYPDHRKSLAEKLYGTAIGSGYMLDFDNEFPEVIFIKKFPNNRIVKVFTAVSKEDGMPQILGMDAIRIAVVDVGHDPDQPFLGCYSIKRINRAGTINSIANRLARALKEAEDTALYAAPKKNKKKT